MSKSFLWGRIATCGKHENVHPRFARAFEFLKRADLALLPPGRYDVDGDACWAMIQTSPLKPFCGETQHAEAHARYIDIQAPLDGPETYGLYTLRDPPFTPFDAMRDIGFGDVATKPLTLQPGEYVIFIPPHGAHAPCLSLDASTLRKKLVIKVRK